MKGPQTRSVTLLRNYRLTRGHGQLRLSRYKSDNNNTITITKLIKNFYGLKFGKLQQAVFLFIGTSKKHTEVFCKNIQLRDLFKGDYNTLWHSGTL